MKPASTTLLQKLAQEYELSAIPQVIAEWNLNRYYDVFGDNTPTEDSEGFDIEMFPIESIYQPNRPSKGINKARINEAKISSGYTQPREARFYIGDYDDIYKYWTSPYPSDATTAALANCAPYIIYGTKSNTGVITYGSVDTNKIVVKFENSWASPATFNIEIRTGGTWVSVFTQTNVTDVTWERKGELILYYNGTNWRQANPAASTSLKTISGIRVTVTALKGGVQEDGTTTQYTNSSAPTTLINTTGKNSHCNVIEISARREDDISADVMTASSESDLADASVLYPIGTLTSNTGEITLWNGDNKYSEDNPASPYKDLLESNVKLTLKYVYDLGSSTESVQDFVMYSDTWGAQKSESVAVNVTDYSKFFQQIIPRPAMWEQLTVPEIIFRVLDSIGYTNYIIEPNENVTDFIIPVFWIDGEKNIWEILDEIAKAAQAAIFFDSYGMLRIKTREAAFDTVRAVDYSLRASASGATLANIATVEQTTEYEANKVNVSYQNTRWSDYNNGQPTLQQVWQPEGDVVLRSSPLKKSMTSTDTYFYVSTTDVKFWPYTGKVNIGGEIIEYEGLEFAYYTYVGTTATKHWQVVKSADEQKKFNDMTPIQYQYRNALTGAVKIKTRALWNTVAAAHSVAPAAYSVRRIAGGTRTNPVWGAKTYPEQSTYELLTNLGYKNENDILFSTVGNAVDTGFFYYGTRIKFVTTANMSTQQGGIMINNDGTTQENGYYIALTKTSRMSATARKTRNELMIYSRTGGKMKAIGGTGNRGAIVAVGENIWYEMDVQFKVVGSTHVIKVWINGKLCLTATISGSDRHTNNGRFGMFAQGRTKAQFEYLYALKNEEAVEPLDDFSFLDKKEGGYVGQAWTKEWIYRTSKQTRIIKKKSTKVTVRNNDKFFDEFGPYVHEIREFDVKFDPVPILHSRLYFTNDWVSSLVEYSGNPFGAKFIMANTGRINAIINGEDTLTFAGSGSSVDQILTVFGRPLVIDEAAIKEFQNDLQVQRRGEIVTELSSPWIQTEAMATAVGEWIVKHMAYGNEELSVEIFGNPLLEATDVVDVYYANRNLTGQKYIVTGVSNSFEAGLTTTLTLRRLNPAI